MPLYDCMLLMKPHVKKEALLDLVYRVGKHVYARNGVLAEVKSFGTVQLGYGIKKLDGRYYEGHMMQMTMMTPPSFNKELHYLNKEDRLLRWLLVKHRDFKSGYRVESLLELEDGDGDEDEGELSRLTSFNNEDDDMDDDDDDDDCEEYDRDFEENNPDKV